MKIPEPVAEETAQRSVLQTLMAATTFTTLLEAIDKAGLTGLLAGDGPFTVFAPNDAAFARLREGYVEAILHDKRRLDEVLKYHIVPGLLTSADIVQYGSVRPFEGTELDFYEEHGQPMVAGAHIVQTDVSCTNGLLHVVDGVLLP
jgi:transforming growth factor-beta-induced protein